MKRLTFFFFIIGAVFLTPAANAQFNVERTWASYYGGNYTFSQGAAMDSEHNVYLATTVRYAISPYSESFVTPGAHQTECNNVENSDICMLTKFNPDGEVI